MVYHINWQDMFFPKIYLLTIENYYNCAQECSDEGKQLLNILQHFFDDPFLK